jgi:hypothetical protein
MEWKREVDREVKVGRRKGKLEVEREVESEKRS